MTDFADIMNKSITGKPKRDPETGQLLNQGLSSTDVTNWDFSKLKPFLDLSKTTHITQPLAESDELKQFRREDFITKLISDRLHNCLDNSAISYGHDLKMAAEERTRMKKLDRLQDIQEAQAHTKKFSSLWGKPGGGAPNNWGVKKVKLDNILGYEDQYSNIGVDWRMRNRRLAEDNTDPGGYVVQDIAPSGSLYEFSDCESFDEFSGGRKKNDKSRFKIYGELTACLRKAYVHPSGLKSHPKVAVKLPIHSDHENFYELPRNEEVHGQYQLYPPYASSV